MSHDTSAVTTDRRKNSQVRARFDEAYDRIRPFLDASRTWRGEPLEFLAYHMLRENYPDLSALETHQLLAAAARVYRSRTAARPRAVEALIPSR